MRMDQLIIEQFIDMYQSLDKDNIDLIDEVYTDNIEFIDSLHTLKGIVELKRYFRSIYSNVSYCQFEIQHSQILDGEAFLVWKMNYSHQKIKSGALIVVEGVSHLKFDQKIHYHRDYLDMGQMLYEHLPLIGGLIQFIKRRAVS